MGAGESGESQNEPLWLEAHRTTFLRHVTTYRLFDSPFR